MTRTELTTPRYWSKCESKISACSGASASPTGAGMRSITASSSSGTPSPVLALMRRTSLGRDAEHVLDLLGVALGLGGREVDLVEAGDDLEVVLEGEVAVGQRLGLDALGRVDEQDDALARGERAGHLVAEVDVAGRVDQVEHVVAARRARTDWSLIVMPRSRSRSIESRYCGPHVAGVDGAADLEDAVAQRGLPVVDVGDDAERADAGQFH